MQIAINSIDRMAARGRLHTNRKSLDVVKKELEVVPPEIIDAIADNNTRLVLVNKGEDPLDVVPADGPPILLEMDAESHGRLLKEALDPILKGVEDKVAHLDGLGRLPTAMQELVRSQRHDVLNSEIRRRSGNLVELLDDATPTTLESIARSRGATTEQEIASFSKMVVTVSGEERLRRAQEAANVPELVPFLKDLPQSQTLVQGHLLIPDVKYFERDGKRMLLPGPNADWARSTEKGEWAGFYRSDINTVFLREEYLGETNEGTSTPVHEFGHAFGDMLSEKYPALFQTFKTARDEAFVELHKDPGKHFPTNYSSVNPSEFVAETFAVRFDPDRAKFPHDGEVWERTLEDSLKQVMADRA